MKKSYTFDSYLEIWHNVKISQTITKGLMGSKGSVLIHIFYKAKEFQVR